MRVPYLVGVCLLLLVLVGWVALLGFVVAGLFVIGAVLSLVVLLVAVLMMGPLVGAAILLGMSRFVPRVRLLVVVEVVFVLGAFRLVGAMLRVVTGLALVGVFLFRMARFSSC